MSNTNSEPTRLSDQIDSRVCMLESCAVSARATCFPTFLDQSRKVPLGPLLQFIYRVVAVIDANLFERGPSFISQLITRRAADLRRLDYELALGRVPEPAWAIALPVRYEWRLFLLALRHLIAL